MGIFQKIKEKRSEQVEVESSLLTALLGGVSKVSKEQALQIPTLKACIGLIADLTSALPIKLYEERDKKVKEITDDKRLIFLNSETGDTLNATEMKKRWVIDYFLGKGAYSYIMRDGSGGILGLYYVDETAVNVNANSDPIFKDYTISVNGKQYLRHDFIKILRNSNGKGIGTSIIKENPTILSIYYNTLKHENATVKKGGAKKGYLKAEKLSKEAIDEIKKKWSQLYSNDSENSESCLVLNGVDFVELSASSVDLQLNQNKNTNAAEICKLVCMPPSILSGTASEQAVSLFLQNCLLPVLSTIEAALDSDLLKESEKGLKYFAFDTKMLTRGDFAKRMNAYATALDHNIFRIDEVRELEDLPPTGFNWLKLNLSDVLLDIHNNQIYTPNTNQLMIMGQQMAKPLDNSGGRGIMDSEERSNPYHDPNNGRFTTASGTQTSAFKLEDISINKSVGAKAQNYDVMDLSTGEIFNFTEGTKIQNVTVFAGKGTNKEFRKADKYAERYGGTAENWQHTKGIGVLDYYGESRKAEVHWVQCEGVGKHEFFIKEWLE